MIHVRVATVDNRPNLIITVNNESILQLKELLHRALNCAAPDKYPDWVALADKLETLK